LPRQRILKTFHCESLSSNSNVENVISH
jgi:hypothetical protein